MNRKIKRARAHFRMSIREAMKEALEEEMQRRRLGTIQETIRANLSGYFRKREKEHHVKAT